MGDNGWMAAVMSPLDVMQETLKEVARDEGLTGSA